MMIKYQFADAQPTPEQEMLAVDHIVEVIEENCIGCKACDRVCPTGAIVTIDRLARVDAEKCTGCNRCIEACMDHGAIKRKFLDEPVVLSVDVKKYADEQIDELCTRARLRPDDSICLCTGTTPRELAVAILDGAKTPEELAVQTGVSGVCSLYCSAPVVRMLRAAGIEVEPDPKNWHLYPQAFEEDISLWGISEEVAEKYPEYRLKQARELLEDHDLTVPVMPTIRGKST